MSETLCAGLLHRETEFATVPAYGNIRVFGACGPCGLASAASASLGSIVHTADVYTLMRQHGLLSDPSGASTIGALQTAATLLKLPIAAYCAYGEPWDDWQAFFTAHAGRDPFMVEVANGQALVDSISGKGENASTLRYHYFAVLGTHSGGPSPYAGGKVLPAGFWCADGDNYAGGNDSAHNFNAVNVLQFYTDTVMAAARPCAALALRGASIPVAWHEQSDHTGKDDKGNVCGEGDMAYITAHGYTSADGLMSETYASPSQSFLALSNQHVVTAKHNPDGSWSIGEDAADLIMTVWQELEALKAQPATKPADPLAQKALDQLTGLKSLLGEL